MEAARYTRQHFEWPVEFLSGVDHHARAGDAAPPRLPSKEDDVGSQNADASTTKTSTSTSSKVKTEVRNVGKDALHHTDMDNDKHNTAVTTTTSRTEETSPARIITHQVSSLQPKWEGLLDLAISAQREMRMESIMSTTTTSSSSTSSTTSFSSCDSLCAQAADVRKQLKCQNTAAAHRSINNAHKTRLMITVSIIIQQKIQQEIPNTERPFSSHHPHALVLEQDHRHHYYHPWAKERSGGRRRRRRRKGEDRHRGVWN